MKHFFFLSFLILIHLLILSQSNITKTTWVGENNEYLNIARKKTTLQKGMGFYTFEVAKYVKNNYIILAKTVHGVEVKQKYNIVRLTKDTLIFAPEKTDCFNLCEPNKQNQYVFANSMLHYQFVELFYETLFYNFDDSKEQLRFIVYIDSAKRSRVVVKDESYNDGKMYTAPPSKIEYERLLKILSSCDLSCFANEERAIGEESTYLVLELRYNDQVKTFNGFSRFPANFADELLEFICDYIELRINIDVKFGWRAYILRRT